MLRLWFLEAESGPMASFITLEWDGTVGLYNSGFEPSWAALSPGLVLLTHLIRDAIARGKTRFDFLRGEERYKYEFGPTPEDVYQVRLA
jgi:CelD/BcsL family acetyltransferase involved in cellulose biosynthesis